jgi:TolA-binding protein
MNMNKRLLFVVALVAIAAAGAFAQAFTVNYLDGVVEQQTGKTWKALAIGDSVPADAVVKLSQTASLELQRGKTKISLLKDGTYDIASLAKAADKVTTTAVGSAITQKLQSLVAEKPKASAAGGVRGAEQGTGGVTWVDEGDESKAQAQALLDQKQYTSAAKILAIAITDASSDQDTSELSYLLGVAYYGAGQTTRAYSVLAKISPTTDLDWYGRYVLLKAQVLSDAGSYKDALAILGPFITAFPGGEAAQTAYLLTGICQKALGDAAAAKTAFDTGYQILPTSDTAKLIDQQRKS